MVRIKHPNNLDFEGKDLGCQNFAIGQLCMLLTTIANGARSRSQALCEDLDPSTATFEYVFRRF